jgi:inhibitor of cysteine peptidase
MEIDERANGTQVRLPVGDALGLRLPENPTTGFRWSLIHAGEPACVPVGDAVEPPSGPPGAGGWHRWRFRAALPGTGQIELTYRRGWERDATRARTFNVEVLVLSRPPTSSGDEGDLPEV